MGIMEEYSDILIVVAVLGLLYLLWAPSSSCGASPACRSGCHCSRCSGFLGGAYDSNVEGITGPEDEEDDAEDDAEDDEAEGLAGDASEFYKSEKEILSGKDGEYNHQAVIGDMALEADVKKSHDSYVDELRGRTTTASKQSIKTDFTPPVPFVGLRARVMYRQMGADKGARVVQSETPKQSLEYSSYSHAPYCL